MAEARTMVAAYVEAGFTKVHLDTSMGCAGESVALPDAITAERAADLAAVAEAPPMQRPSRRRSTSSAPKSRCQAARSRPSTTCR